MKCGFPIDFSMLSAHIEYSVPLTPLKSASKMRTSSFVTPSKFFRLLGVNVEDGVDHACQNLGENLVAVSPLLGHSHSTIPG
jgi:hypothetical protein